MRVEAASERDPRFDSLRGLLLILMAVDHLPSALRWLTDRPLGVFSAAEGFVFLAGLLAGTVYTKRRRRNGIEELRSASRRRAWMIYQWHLGSFLLAFIGVRLTSWFSGFSSPAAPQLFHAHPGWALLLGPTLLYQPGLLDILPLYCLLVLALPFILRALEAGARWPLLAASFGLWLAMQGGPRIERALLYPVNLGAFNLLAWQFLFILGVVIGHARVTDPGPQITFRPVLIAGCAAVAVFCWGIQHLGWRPPWPDDLFGISLNKPDLGFLRLADFGVLAYLTAVLGAAFPSALCWAPLAFLGRHSIAVFAAQSVASVVLVQFRDLFSGVALNWGLTVAMIGFLYATAALHRFWQQSASPAFAR